jgi:hypothetical protein
VLYKIYDGIFETNVGFIAKSGKITEKRIHAKQIPVIKGEDIIRYYIIGNHWFEFEKDNLAGGTQDKKKLGSKNKIFLRKTGIELYACIDNKGFYPEQSLYFIHSTKADIDQFKYICSFLNSTLLNCFYRFFSVTNRDSTPQLKKVSLDTFPIYPAIPDQQAPIISLVDAIIQKKKEYHSISQNIEDYIPACATANRDFEKTDLIRLDEFLKNAVKDFEVLSSIKVKNDNFDVLRVRTEEEEFILEYGTRRKIEEYEEIDEEDEQIEIKSKYIIEWQTAGKGKIKDIEAIEFLTKVLEGTKNFSKASQKSIWQKIAEVKVPEFDDKIKEDFLRFKSAIQKARQLDEEITKIDRAIDRLVYDLYGLTEEEIKTVEKSVWGEKFEEMYKKLPSKGEALKLSEEVRDG